MLTIECERALKASSLTMPAASLANDMMIFYALREIYTLNVTVVEAPVTAAITARSIRGGSEEKVAAPMAKMYPAPDKDQIITATNKAGNLYAPVLASPLEWGFL